MVENSILNQNCAKNQNFQDSKTPTKLLGRTLFKSKITDDFTPKSPMNRTQIEIG